LSLCMQLHTYVTYERIFRTNVQDLGLFEYRVGLLRVYYIPYVRK